LSHHTGLLLLFQWLCIVSPLLAESLLVDQTDKPGYHESSRYPRLGRENFHSYEYSEKPE